jgi:23S rRNA (guanosine2251-2'-O)-methyltransferase
MGRGFAGPRPSRPWDDRPRDRGDRPRPYRPRPEYPPDADRPLAPPERLADDEELVAGRRPVEEAFAARRPARRLLVVPERRLALEQLVLHATALRIPVVEVEGGTLTSLAGFDGHQGVALVVEPRRWATLDEVVARARERSEPPFVLVLDSLEDPQNVGTLLRSAEACGIHGVLFPVRRSAPITAAAVKASAGAVEHLLLVPLDDLAAGLVELHGRGLRLVGADEQAALAYRDADLRGPLGLVVGSEARGISGALRRRVDLAVRIPMHGKVSSLNAAVAGSVLLFEAAAQRGLPAVEPGDGEVEAVAPDSQLEAAEAADSEPATPGAIHARTPRPGRARTTERAVEESPARDAVTESTAKPRTARARKAPAEATDDATSKRPTRTPRASKAAAEAVGEASASRKPRTSRSSKTRPAGTHARDELLPGEASEAS